MSKITTQDISSRRKIVAMAVFCLVVGAVLGLVAGRQLSHHKTGISPTVHHIYSRKEVHALMGNLALGEELDRAEISAQRMVANKRQKLIEEECQIQNRHDVQTAAGPGGGEKSNRLQIADH
jgi:hypothetical protein